MPTNNIEGGVAYRVTATGKQVVTNGGAQIIGITFCGSATGQVQLFAGATASASLTPVISFCATTSAVIGGFSPMFLRMPMVVSGTGLLLDAGATTDPNLILYWNPLS